MTFNFFADDESNTKLNFGDSKKIKEPVTINISIEIEKSKFEALNKKYESGIAGRIFKLFK